jgi:hypothetical protein
MWEHCYSSANEFQAHLVKGYLEQFGVPCLIEGGRPTIKPLGLGEVRLLVRADWLHIAQGLIRGREAAPAAAPHLRLVTTE